MEPTRASGRELLVLTAAAVNLELLLLTDSLRRDDTVVMTSALLTAFHCGYLAADRLSRSAPERLRIAGATSLAAATVALSLDQPWVALLPVMLASSALQALRRQLKARSSSRIAKKNLSKFVAMLTAGAAASPIGILALGSAWALAIGFLPRSAAAVDVSRRGSNHVGLLHSPLHGGLLATEFLHHVHYFLYCYILWRLIPEVPLASLGALFSLGWLAYFVAEGYLASRRDFSPAVLATGHVLCAGCLFVMSQVTATEWMMVLWFVTGVGGGTAYMLGNGPQAPRRERAEDWGHVGGTALGGGVGMFAGAPTALIAAGFASLGTAAASLLIHRQIAMARRRPVCV